MKCEEDSRFERFSIDAAVRDAQHVPPLVDTRHVLMNRRTDASSTLNAVVARDATSAHAAPLPDRR